MTIFLRLAAFAMLALASPLAAQDIDSAGPEGSDTILRNAQRGLAIFQRDRAAWHTTDAMLEDLSESEYQAIRGWVIAEVQDGLRVTYVAPAGDSFEAIYSATFGADGISDRQVHTAADNAVPEDLLEQARASAAVRQTAIDPEEVSFCAPPPYNLVVLPSEAPGEPLLTYLLTPQPDNQTVQNGGHHRFAVLNGEIVDHRSFARSCLELSAIGVDENGNSMRAEMAVVSHSLDPIPTEIHVFNMLSLGIPLGVITTENETIWNVGMQDGQLMVVPIGNLSDPAQ